jgi:hypothetical protein
MAHGFGSDARKEEEVVALVEQIESHDRRDRGAGVQHRRQRPSSILERPRGAISRSGRWPAVSGFLNGRSGQTHGGARA